jgi:molybdenum cofactor cytidylyltransferase
MAQAPVGILLAAGRGSRFDASGGKDKLLAILSDGRPVAVASAEALLGVTGRVIAVIRPGREALAAVLRAAGCEVLVCPDSDKGMGHTLAFAVAQSMPAGGGWIVALADMPHVKPATILALKDAVEGGALTAAPLHGGRRGNPVAFSAVHAPALLALEGDQGARSLVNTPATLLIAVDDPGIHRDVDQPSDLD